MTWNGIKMKKHKKLTDDDHIHAHLCGSNTPFHNRECCSDDWNKVDCKNCLIKDKKLKWNKESKNFK